MNADEHRWMPVGPSVIREDSDSHPSLICVHLRLSAAILLSSSPLSSSPSLVMPDPFQKVQSGQPLRIPAETFNAFLDAAQDFR